MKVKLGQIYNSVKDINSLMEKELPIKCSYKLSKNADVLSKEIQKIEDKRLELVNKYKEKPEDTKISDEKMSQFIQEFNNLLNTEIEIELQTINIEDFGNINLSASILSSIKFFVDASSLELQKQEE